MPVQAITDDFATLFWRDKASKANVTAKYYIIPFVENSDEIKSVSSSLTEEYVLTNYSLGSPIGPISFDKAISQTNQLGESQIFTRQGIYYFTLTDDAGNSVNYVFVIDKTEMFFKVTQGSEQAKVSKYVSNDYILSQNDVKVEIGTHKAIDLSYNLQDNADKSMVTSVITGLFSGGLEGYYAEQNTNKIALQNLLSNFNGTYYLTVKQKNLLICDENGTAISAGEITAPTTKTVKLNSTDSTFVWNNFFVLGENQTEIIQNSNSNLMVEINTDQALGMAYYSNDSMTLGAIPNGNLSNDKGNINRLILENDSIQKTHATKDNNLAFVWRLNVGETKVSKITYTYYNLSLDNYTEDYFFQSNSGDTTIFVDGSEDEKLKADDQDEARALKFIDISKDGLYIITRTLANGETLSYKLIIDRTGIIEADKLDNNNLNILINLLENETQFTNFNNPGKNDGKLYYYNNQTEATVNTPYKYFVTNKVPATISIPKSKFIKGENESTYNAGRLNYEMYFVDTQTQLQNDKNKAFKVLEGKVEGGNEDKGNFTINLNDSLNFGDIKNEYLLKLKNSNNLQNWLTLPGDYVVIIKDAVETASNPTQQIVAFRIKQKYPTPQVYASSSETGEQVYATGDSGQYNLTTNKRYININLPKYIGEDATANENLNAQLDQNYLVITKNGTDYLRHEYKHMSGVQLSEVSKDTDGNLIVKLDTFVNGSASFENSTYVITVRYKLSGLDEHNQTINEKYKDCYYYYDQNRKIQYYYETKIVIKLDRIPPETNLNNLISKDTLINTYEQEQNCKMFTDTEIEKPGETYFVKQYTEFYQSKNVKDLFALHLYGDDSFEIGDVKNVYINKIANLENFNWNLPLSQTPISLDSYKNVSNLTYGIVAENLKLEEGSYYEIIEEDMAGNLTQYLVLYCGNVGNEKTTHDDLKIQIPINGVGEDNNKIQIDLSDSATNYNITMFGFDEDENATIVANRGNDYFYHFELSKGGSFVTSFNTNASTSFSKAGIISQIKELFTTAGNYTLKVSSRTKTVSISINYILEKIALSAQDLVQEGETYYINLNGANTTVDGVNYYATEIKLLYTNNNSAVSETYIYTSGEWYKNETKVDSIIKCDKDTTYEVILTDICGNTSRYMFNTNGKKFTDITFGKDDLLESAKIGDTYYSFQQAKITFDQIFNAVEINDEKYTKTANGWQQENNITNLIKTEENGVNYLVLDFEKINNVIQQEKLEFIIKFYVKENDTDEKISYHIVLDNRTAHTTLSEVATDKDQEMNVDYNIDDLLKTEAKSSTSGVMNLSWTDYTSDYFDFEYQLIEWTDIANNLSDEHDISGVNAYTIRTSKDSDGLYRFVITVLDKQTNKVLGNKVYTFRVQAKLNELYYVEKGNIAISPNAYFVKSNITDYIYDNSLKLTDLDITEDDLPTSKIDLYITNEEVVVLPATDLGAGLLSTKAITLSSGTFTLHRIYTHSISQYVGVLQVSESSNLINNIKITTTDSASSISINPNDGLSHVINGQKTDIVKVTFNQIVTGSTDISNLEKKNTIQLKVSYNNKPVGIYDLDSGLLEDENSSYSYTIKGNGQYTFEFLDKAGNTHIFETTYNNTSKLDINVLREVIVSVKENHPEKETEATAPIDNAFYNYPVTISVLQAQNYEFGSISVSATLQGEKYTPDKNQYDYTFEKYGTYKVTITATNEYGQTIKKILNFTIINQNEAINSIDLNVLSGYEITDVIYFSEAQNKKENITDTFKNTLINKNIGNGMSLTYDEVLEMYSTLGKKSFTLKYKVADNIYPTREQEFTFTLNNAVPYIECSLKPGESTTKSFTVTFNPGIIYSQVGDCELFIGGERVAEINIKSNSVPDTITITEKDNGAGDYYITLKSTSGNVITSFKVVVKEPLNAWAIVIIVVVVLVVGTIVTIIILLRTRMRIR